MLDRLKEALFLLYNPEEKKGCFLSAFDVNKKLLLSQGMVDTDKPLREVVEQLYTQYITSQLDTIHYIVIDVVVEIVSFAASNDIFQLDPKEYGLLVEDLGDDTTAVILPNLAGVTDMKQVLYDLKKKYAIHGNAAVSGFKTERIVVAK